MDAQESESRTFVYVVSMLLLLAIFASPQHLAAQVAGGTVSGVISDPSGAAIPEADITVKNLATGITRTAKTNAGGLYSVPNLVPGEYEVTVTASGFKGTTTRISLTVGAETQLNIAAEIGSAHETVDVTGVAAGVQLTTSNLGQVVDAKTISEMPLNGRSWTDLAPLQPGVAQSTTQLPNTSTPRGNRGFASQLAISGSRSTANNYRLDGVSLNDYANSGPSNVMGGSLGVDAIREFSVLTTNASAEYGKTSGGVVNAISRSGSNDFHGDVYEFIRNSALDAQNYFNLGPNPTFRRNQFGGAVGGPIIKNKTFFFADYEGIRQAKGITELDVVPSMAARAGNLAAGPVVVDPSVQKFLPLWPDPNGQPIGSGDTATFSWAGQQVVHENFVTGRVDHTLGSKDNLVGTYLFDQSPFVVPSPLQAITTTMLVKRQTVVAEETHIFSQAFVNTVRFGYTRDRVDNGAPLAPINPLTNDTSLSSVPGKRAPVISVSGLTTFNGGMDPTTVYLFRWSTFQGYDDAFVTKGRHSIKFGGSFERDHNDETVYTQMAGTWSFGSLANFLTNQPKSFQAYMGTSPITPRNVHTNIVGAYIQDDWRFRPNLTLNLGMRYETSSVPSEADGKVATLLNITDVDPRTGNPIFQNPTQRNFEPRVGFAWSPFHKDTTAVRGAFGIYDTLPLPYYFLTLFGRAYPFFQLGQITSLPAGSFPTDAYSLLGPKKAEKDLIQQDPGRSYVMEWNLNIEQELPGGLTATAGYVGQRGVHQGFQAGDANMVMPIMTPDGYLWPVGGTKINPATGAIRVLNWTGDTYYDALQVGVNKRMSHGFEAQGSFTWGKSIDTSSGAQNSQTYANSVSNEFIFDNKLNRSLSDFNVGRLFVANMTWTVPKAENAPRSLAWIINGWQAQGIFKVSDGEPFTPTFAYANDPLGTLSGDPYAYPNRLTGPGCSNATNPGNRLHYIKTECFAIPVASPAVYAAYCNQTTGTGTQCFNLLGNARRNSLIGPGLLNLDLSLVKNAKLSERVSMQFRAESFNILNHPNFAPPDLGIGNTDIFTASGALNPGAGLLTSTTTDNRELQFGVKFTF